MYEQIASNKRKTYLLFIAFFLLVGLMGYVFGFFFWGNWIPGFTIAWIIAIVFSLFSYYSGHKMVLAMTKAKEARKPKYAYLINTVEGLSIAAGLPKPKVYVIESDALNAFASGRDPKNSIVCVTTGLIERLNRQELEGVLAHELSHIKNYDIRTMMLAATLVGVVAFMSDIMIRSLWFGGGRRDNNGGNAIFMVIGIVLAILAPIAAYLIKMAVSRKREYLADASGAMLTRYPKGLADALRKISKDPHILKSASNATAHLFISNPFGKRKIMFSNLFSTHPPLEARIKKLEAM